jgi:hypothetical protein
MKRCSNCGIEKELSEFYKCNQKYNKDKLSYSCKECNRIMHKKHREQNKEKVNNRQREWREKNKEKLSATNKKKGKIYYEKNRDAQLEKRKINYKKNRKKEILYNCEYIKNKRNTDASFKLMCNIRNLFTNYLKRGKTKSFFKYTQLNYSYYTKYLKENYNKEFDLYLESGQYHIDHIIPCCLYDFEDEEEIKKCWQPENLRIIPAEENLSKSGKLDMDLVIEHNIQHLLPKKIQRRSA